MLKREEVSQEIKETIMRNKDMVYRLAYSQMKNKDDADDVFQDVFCRYIKRQQKFNSAEHEKAWFIRVTLNCCKTAVTSFWKTRVDELDENTEMPEIEKHELEFALNQLPKKYNAVLHLFYYEDLSAEKIAAVLKTSTANVRMLLTRARRALKEILERSENDEKNI